MQEISSVSYLISTCQQAPGRGPSMAEDWRSSFYFKTLWTGECLWVYTVMWFWSCHLYEIIQITLGDYSLCICTLIHQSAQSHYRNKVFLFLVLVLFLRLVHQIRSLLKIWIIMSMILRIENAIYASNNRLENNIMLWIHRHENATHASNNVMYWFCK